MAGIKDLAKVLSEQTNQPQTVCKKLIELVFENVQNLLVDEDVSIRGFGVFKSRPILEHVTKNPQTREETVVGDSVRVYLTPSDAIKKYLKENKPKSFWDDARAKKEGTQVTEEVSE